eukprot:m.72575 g.72575  ORF g.72575 m.72575 type:complete len:51 (+) comp13862_c0_seq8:1349-1501(+)
MEHSKPKEHIANNLAHQLLTLNVEYMGATGEVVTVVVCRVLEANLSNFLL